VRQGEDHMEVLHRQEVRRARLEPPLFGERLALGAVPVPARVVGNPERPALVAGLRMPPPRAAVRQAPMARRARCCPRVRRWRCR
jgi:hypothetical protein